MGKTKKSTYKTLAEAIAFDGLKKVELPTEKVNYRKLTVDEIKECIMEAFKDAKSVKDVELAEPPRGWGDSELARQMDFIKKLNLDEFFNKKSK